MLVLAHRGASAAAPENSVAAFELADAMGADGVELDVRRTADGRMFVAHDVLPDDVAAVDALHLATLDDALDACGDRMLVNVEIKNWPADADFDPTMAIVAAVVDTLRRRGPGARDRWLVSSFSWDTLEAVREQAPELATAWLVSTVSPERLPVVAAAGHRALHPHEPRVDRALVERCHAAGLAVNTWTCNDASRLVDLAALGVDGVCTDVPDVALSALGRDGPTLSPAWARPG
jgi:glycerophosphoryl diester phosphodiesterase